MGRPFEPRHGDDPGGIDALPEQLSAECLRHGAGQAAEVLVVVDEAMWI